MVSRTAEQHISIPLLRAAWDLDLRPLARDGSGAGPAPVAGGLDRRWVRRCRLGRVDAIPDGEHATVGDSRPTGRDASSPGFRRCRAWRSCRAHQDHLRTYVRGPDGRDGLWFFSIDIGSATLATALRTAVGAPYHKARLTVTQQDDSVTYTGDRVGAPSPTFSGCVRASRWSPLISSCG
jgi:uncharacterized protein